jgi:hypothetical protein
MIRVVLDTNILISAPAESARTAFAGISDDHPGAGHAALREWGYLCGV